MKTRKAIALTGFMFAGGYGCVAEATERPIIICASQVNGFIDRIHFGDRFSGSAAILASKGYAVRWEDAIAGEGKIIDGQGVGQKLRIFAVPFINSNGVFKASIIGGIFQSDDGGYTHEFIATNVIPSDGIHIGEIIIPPGITMPDVEIKPLLQSLISRDRSEIWDYVLRNAAIQADVGGGIRTMFESNGFYCSPAPIWFPEKSIWYAATCIPRIQ